MQRLRWIVALALVAAAPVAGVAASRLPAEGHPVRGVVADLEGVPLEGALVVAGSETTTTDVSGGFELVLPAGRQQLVVTRDGYLEARLDIVVGKDLGAVEVRLTRAFLVAETLTVEAIRAGEDVPVTKRDIDLDEIERLSYGQDVPALLSHSPSITWYSDSGLGSNYSYFRLRGIDQTRVNLTLDGAPLNDPAEHALYFNNFHDLTSAVESIQVQRGVGTSTVGSPSYGGSVNFASVRPAEERQAELRLGLGSHATRRASLAMHSGKLAGGLTLFGRVSYQASDGYRERSGTEHDSVFFNASWQGERSRLNLVSFSGRERSELAFLAVDAETLRENPRFNPLAAEERDRFGQDFLQLQLLRPVGRGLLLTASLYYNGADGWFRLWGDPVEKENLLEFGIDQHFVGSLVSLTHTGRRSETTIGVHYNDFQGEHTLDASGGRLYANTGLKEQASAFLKTGYDLDPWFLYGDVHLRWAEFDYRGSVDLGSVDWLFVDPRVGLRYKLTPALDLYASLGQAEREPSRLDLLAGEDNASIRHDLEAVEPERVVDLELGIEYRSADLGIQAVLYAMEFDNEIAATGELSEIGLPLRTNVDDSYRRGVELDLRWRPARSWTIGNATNLSRNRIRSWTQFYDVYDADGEWVGSEARVHRDVEPLLTPEVVVNQSVEWSGERLDLALEGRWVGSMQLDNTGDGRFRAPGYLTVGLRAAADLERLEGWGRPRLALHLDNLLDERDHWAGGYSYRFITLDERSRESVGGTPYYYPLAGRTFAVTVEFSL
jgi:iron complex outermembrane receptor protein